MVSMILVLWGFKDKTMLYCFREVKWQQGLHSRNLILGKCGRAALRSALYNLNQAVQDGLLFALQFWH